MHIKNLPILSTDLTQKNSGGGGGGAQLLSSIAKTDITYTRLSHFFCTIQNCMKTATSTFTIKTDNR
jgi:hypothetical protein